MTMYSFEGSSLCKSHRCEQSERREKLLSSVPSFCKQDLHPSPEYFYENLLSPGYTRSCKLVAKGQQVPFSEINANMFLVPHGCRLFIVVALRDFEADSPSLNLACFPVDFKIGPGLRITKTGTEVSSGVKQVECIALGVS